MLGELLSDPEGVENGGTMRGMGILPMETVFAQQKTRTRVSGQFTGTEGEWKSLEGVAIEGYEIHMGETVLREGAVPASRIRDDVTGAEKEDGAMMDQICGTYVHGIFDRREVVEAVLNLIGRRKGVDVSQMKGMDFAAFKETQYDLLAEGLRKHLDMKKIYEILEQGVQA